MSNRRKKVKEEKQIGAEDKLELAARIANSGNRIQHTYESIESSLLRIIHWFSNGIDKILFNQKYSKLIAFLLAVLLYFLVNIGEYDIGVTQSGYVLENIPLTVSVDDSVYEVSGLPSTVSASIIGDVSDISMLRNSNTYKVVADLTGLGEGTHEVDLIATDFSSKLSVAVTPSRAVVTIRKKITRSFSLSYDYVNLNQLDEIYVLGTPTLSTSVVNVRASEDTLNQIAFVKALIDVSARTENFSTEASLAAYDSNGNRVNVSLIPSVVNVEVPVSSPNKTVEVVVKPVGEVPNNMAIDTINLDHSTVTLYGPLTALSTIDAITVEIDATTLTENASYTSPIMAPSGINKMSIQRVVMSVSLGERVSRVIENVPIQYKNNINGYRANVPEGETATASVIVYGTRDNVNAISANDLEVSFNMANITPGVQEVTLSVTGNNPLLTYELEKPTIVLEIIE